MIYVEMLNKIFAFSKAVKDSSVMNKTVLKYSICDETKRSIRRILNVPNGEERGETDVFAGYVYHRRQADSVKLAGIDLVCNVWADSILICLPPLSMFLIRHLQALPYPRTLYTRKPWTALREGVRRKLCLFSKHFMLCFSFRFVPGNVWESFQSVEGRSWWNYRTKGNLQTSQSVNGYWSKYHRAMYVTLFFLWNVNHVRSKYLSYFVTLQLFSGFLSDWHSAVVFHWFKTTVWKKKWRKWKWSGLHIVFSRAGSVRV